MGSSLSYPKMVFINLTRMFNKRKEIKRSKYKKIIKRINYTLLELV